MVKVKLGLLISQSGPTGIWAPSSINAAVLAAAEFNAGGGVLGKEIELVARDPGWDHDSAVAAAHDLLDEGVSVVVGMVGSNIRRSASFALATKAPFVYTPNFEMDQPEPIIPIGSTDDLLLQPLLAWIEQRFGARRFVLVGADYRWPRKTMPMAARMVAKVGGEVLGIYCRPIDASDEWDDRTVDDIRRAAPDLVLTFLTGDQGIPFYRAFCRGGLAGKLPRCALATDESVIQSLEPDETEGLFACANYFASAPTHSNRSFMERYWSAFGEFAPIPNAYGQSCYEGINFAVGLLRAAGRADRAALMHVAPRSVQFRSARFDDADGYLGKRQPVFVAEAKGPCFDVVCRL